MAFSQIDSTPSKALCVRPYVHTRYTVREWRRRLWKDVDGAGERWEDCSSEICDLGFDYTAAAAILLHLPALWGPHKLKFLLTITGVH